jgi:hypothetical protein
MPYKPSTEPSPARIGKDTDSHLRSTKAVTGYHIEALDGELGHVDGFIVDDESWAIRYMEVATRNWWPGKKVLVSPAWIERTSWEDSEVYVSLSRDAIKSAPELFDLRPSLAIMKAGSTLTTDVRLTGCTKRNTSLR